MFSAVEVRSSHEDAPMSLALLLAAGALVLLSFAAATLWYGIKEVLQ